MIRVCYNELYEASGWMLTEETIVFAGHISW